MLHSCSRRRRRRADHEGAQASIHAIMESDDRVVGVVKQLDDALAELDKMDLMIGLYKTQLNVRRVATCLSSR